MKCCYINLDSAPDRRALLEADFSAHAPADWSIQRIPAISAIDVQRHGVKGSLRDAEKACMLSHAYALGLNLNLNEPLLILEDDAQLGPLSLTQIDQAIELANANGPWDLLFTDIVTPLPQTMLELFRLRRRCRAIGRLELLDLSGLCFAGTTGYVVHPTFIAPLFAMLDSQSDLQLPYDLLLRSLITSRQVRAWAAFPFPTTVRHTGGHSSIQLPRDVRANQVWDAFRRSVWAGADPHEIQRDAEFVSKGLQTGSAAMMGLILAAAIEASAEDVTPA